MDPNYAFLMVTIKLFDLHYLFDYSIVSYLNTNNQLTCIFLAPAINRQ